MWGEGTYGIEILTAILGTFYWTRRVHFFFPGNIVHRFPFFWTADSISTMCRVEGGANQNRLNWLELQFDWNIGFNAFHMLLNSIINVNGRLQTEDLIIFN